MKTITRCDKHGAYIEVPDDDNDLVTLIKKDGKFIYRIRGDAINKLARLEHLEIVLQIAEGIKN